MKQTAFIKSTNYQICEDGTLYESISEASRQTGWSVSHLRNMLLNNRTNKTNLEFYGNQ